MAVERTKRALLAVVLVASGVAGACDAGQQAGEASDSSPTPLGWSIESVFEAGGLEADGELAFGDVAAVTFGPDGRLYVIDGDARHVVVIDEAGRFVRTLGEPGEGPGSLAWPTGLVVKDGGEVVVLDSARRRWVRFGPGGEVLEGIAIADDVPLPRGPLALHASGKVLGTRDDVVEGAGPRPVLLHSVGADSALEGADTVWGAWRPTIPEGRALTPEETGGLRVRLPPLVGFHPHVHSAPLDDGRIVVADSTVYHLRIIDLDDGVTETLRRPGKPVSTTEALRNAERDRRLTELEADPPAMVVSDAQGRSMGVADDPVMRLERARIDAMGFHDEIPVIAALAVDAEGRLWVGRSGATPGDAGPIDVLEVDLSPIGTVPAGAMAFPTAFGPDGRVAHVTRGDFGAPRVTVSRWIR
ncbi:MAG: hypothetical protein KJP18_07615 [Gemmatimonadetes bacterium]|nr:hypothetical protein [Gemmatimonadota bacterium]